MTGSEEVQQTGEKIRRIFAEQYLTLADFIKIYEKESKFFQYQQLNKL
jgi:hypothetical protein